MRREVFADTSYWVALVDKTDALHQAAQFASIEVRDAQIVTTESVLIEVVNFFSRHGQWMRQKSVAFTQEVLHASGVTVMSSSRVMLIAGLDLHFERPDKGYSLTDCISMQMMRELGIFEILTHDQHFAQEGFVALMRGAA